MNRQATRHYNLWLLHQTLSVAALWRALGHRDSDVRYSAGAELHRRGGVPVFAKAAQWCRSRHPRRREMGAFVLGQLGSPQRTHARQAQAVLQPLLADACADVRAAALCALGHNGRPGVVAAALALEADRSAEVRWSVAAVLDGSRSKAAIDALLRLTHDRVARVRDWAAFALGNCAPGQARVIRRLHELLADRDAGVRDEVAVFFEEHPEARDALRAIDGPESAPAATARD
jgi:HEAT repeat protein